MSNAVVVGAGPLGLMSALALNEEFESLALVGPAAPKDGRTTAILNEGIALLDDLGVWASLAPKSAPLKAMRIVDGSRRLVRAPEACFEADELGIECFGYNIENTDLLAALADAVAARTEIVRIEKPVSGATLTDRSRAVLHMQDAGTLEAELIVAADGRNSIMREAAGIGVKKWSYPQTAIVANFAHSRDHGFTSTEFHTESGPFTLVPLPGRRSSLVWMEKNQAAAAILALPPQEFQRLAEEKAHFLLGAMTLESAPMAYPLAGLTAREFAQGPVVLVGESAHVFPPIGAQGMNLGIRDLKALIRCLGTHPVRRGLSTDALAHAYTKARRADIALRTHAVDALNRTLLTGLLPAHLGRGLGIFAANTIPSLRKFIMRQGLGA